MSSNATSSRVERLNPDDSEIDPEIAEWVGQEILADRLEPAAWARALAISIGSREDALAAYARIRMRQLTSRRLMRRSKSLAFEARRTTNCLGVKTVKDLLARSNRGGQSNLLKPRLSYVWLVILMLGCAGSVASLGRLQAGMLPDGVGAWLPGISLACGIGIVVAVLGLRMWLPKRWVMLGWNTGVMAACSLACFGSLWLGAKLIARTSPEVLRALASRQAAVIRPVAEPVQAGEPMVVKPRLPLPTSRNATALIPRESD